jgi:predicted DNA-binding protein
MKRQFIIGAIFFMILYVPGISRGTTGEEVSIPVRVFQKGAPVDNLTAADFKLFKDEKPQTLLSAKIQVNGLALPTASTSSSRYFVLLFRVNEYSSQLQKGLLYLFNNLLRENDQLLIGIDEQTLFFSSLANKEKARLETEKFLQEQTKFYRQMMFADLSTIEKMIDQSRIRAARETTNVDGARTGVHLHYYMKYMKFSLEQYISALEAYKKRYFAGDINTHYYLLKPGETIDREKWLIQFFQMPEIPGLSPKNRTMIRELIRELQEHRLSDENLYSEFFTKMLSEIDDLFNAVPDFPLEEMTRLYNRMGTHFNSIFIRDTGERVSRGETFSRLSKDIEERLAGLAKQTGGTAVALVDKNDTIESALNTIGSAKDIYYMLTYIPSPAGAGKIKIDTANKEYDVFFVDAAGGEDFSPYTLNEEKSGNTAVQLKDILFKDRNLAVTIFNFLKAESGGKEKTGRVVVRIYIKDTQNRQILFDQCKIMLPQKDVLHLSLDFPWLAKGSYEVGTYVYDFLSREIAFETIPAVVY